MSLSRTLAAIERGLLTHSDGAGVAAAVAGATVAAGGGAAAADSASEAPVAERRAVVACILRERLTAAGGPSRRPLTATRSDTRDTGRCHADDGRGNGATAVGSERGESSVANRGGNADEGPPLDVLFILRASRRGGGRWSGQVGFPGGHVEVGESDTAAVAREVREEIGLDLTRPNAYRLLGEVTPRVVGPAQGSASHMLLLRCLVYFQLDARGEALVPDPSEVAAAGWAPLGALLSDRHVQPLGWSEMTGAAPEWDAFPSVHLPMHAPVVAAEGVDAEDAARRFRLWGLTLRVVNDWLAMCGLRRAPIDVAALRARF